MAPAGSGPPPACSSPTPGNGSGCEACGGGGIVALMKALKMNNYNYSSVVAKSDSGDITGDESEVVGYLSAVIYN